MFQEMSIIICGLYSATRYCEDILAEILTSDQNAVGGTRSLLELQKISEKFKLGTKDV